MSIDQIVSVTMLTAANAVPVPAFGTTLIAGQTAGWLTGSAGDVIRFYTSLTGVATDFLTSTPEYNAAAAAFSQNPVPAQIAIGKVPAIVQQVWTIVFSANLITGNVIPSGTVNGVTVAATNFTTDNPTTLTALANAIAAVTDVASATSDGVHTITVTMGVGVQGTLTGFSPITGGASQATVTITNTVAAVIWSTGLAAIRAVSNAFYGVTITDRNVGSIMDAASWVETQTCVGMFATGDANVISTATTDVATRLKAKSYKRSGLIYHALSTEYPAAAWLALMLSYAPGSANWMFKTLAGVSAEASPTFTQTNHDNAIGGSPGPGGKNCNLYHSLNGVAMTEKGLAVGGQYLDITVGLDWIKTNLQSDILTYQMSAPKVPYTDAGVASFEALLRKRIKLAQDAGIVATVPAPTYTIPTVASQAATSRQNRDFPGITVSGNLAGAIDTAAFTITLVP